MLQDLSIERIDPLQRQVPSAGGMDRYDLLAPPGRRRLHEQPLQILGTDAQNTWLYGRSP
jgi:hypothetical protein